MVNPSSAKANGTLSFALSGTPDSLDPGNTYGAWTWNFSRLYATPLMTYQSAPGAAGNMLVPGLATAPGAASADGLTWTYHIKPGLKFSDGEPITSADVKYAVERTYDRSVLDNGPNYFQVLLGDPKYPGPYKDPKGDLTSVTTPDSTTIEFHLTAPFPDFNYVAAIPQTAPVPQDKDTGASYQLDPVSSGPYMFQSYSEEAHAPVDHTEHPGAAGACCARPDVAGASAALSAASGFTVGVAYHSDQPEEVRGAQALQAALAKVGITVQLNGYPSGGYYSDFAGSPNYVHTHDLGIDFGGWSPEWPDGYGMLNELVNGTTIVPAGNTNVSEENNPQVNALFADAAKQGTSTAQRAADYGQVDKLVMGDAVILPEVYGKSLLYRGSDLTNVYAYAPFGMYNYAVLGKSS